MIVVYDFDSNNILVDPLKNIQSGIIKTTCSLINDTLSNGGVMPKLYLLYHEESIELKAAMTKKSIIS